MRRLTIKHEYDMQDQRFSAVRERHCMKYFGLIDAVNGIDEKKMTPKILQDHIDEMPAWLSQPYDRHDEESQEWVEERSVLDGDWPRVKDMVFKAGMSQAVGTQNVNLTSATLAAQQNQINSPSTMTDTITIAEAEAAIARGRLQALVDGLQRVGISRAKALLPGLWEMRTMEQDSEASDKDSSASEKAEEDMLEGRNSSDDSDEEL
jgi:hypothetical protein